MDPYFAHCKAHCDKDIAKRKVRVWSHDIALHVTCKQLGDDLCLYVCVQRRDYLTAMSKQKKFKFDDTDDRVCMPK